MKFREEPEIGSLKELKTLYLQSPNITDAGKSHFAALYKLTTLYLIGTKVTDAGLTELGKKLPNCKITKIERL